jgi:hypothetical protein
MGEDISMKLTNVMLDFLYRKTFGTNSDIINNQISLFGSLISKKNKKIKYKNYYTDSQHSLNFEISDEINKVFENLVNLNIKISKGSYEKILENNNN